MLKVATAGLLYCAAGVVAVEFLGGRIALGFDFGGERLTKRGNNAFTTVSGSGP